MTLIGRDLSRPDATDKVRGEARFVDDLAFPGMLYARVVRSPFPHARIRRLDLSLAASHPRVYATVTAQDVPGENVVRVIYDDQPALASDVARYVGEPVALVLAEDRESAREAAVLARVEYEELPGVFDPAEALRPGAPVVAVPCAAEGKDESPNLLNRMHVVKGDVERGFAEADVVIEGEYRTGYQEHAYMETQGTIAVPEEQGAMTIYGSLQCPFYVQGAVAKVLGLPLAKVRVVQTATGGAFGGKEDVPSHLASLAALGAWKTRRPVKLVYDREEDMLTTSKRHPSVVRYKSGAKKDGTLTAIEVDFVYNAGAYQTLSSAVLWRGLLTAAGPYRVPNVKIVGRSVATNTVPNGAFRGFGSPQVIFAHESQMDLLAERLGIDRVEIRRRNALRVGDETACGQRLKESVGVLGTIDRARELSHWDERLREVASFNATHANRRRGVGISSVLYGVGLGAKSPFLDKAGAYLKLEGDGSVTLAVGTVEMGQGLTAALSQIVCDALGISADRLQFAPVDTTRVPDSGPTVASRGTLMSGLAALDAAQKLHARILEVGKGLGIKEKGIPKRLPEIARAFFLQNLDPAVEGWAHTAPVDWDPQTGLGNPYFVYSYATHVAQVEVDLTTGEVSLEDCVAVHDSGKVLNLGTASGQVEGGIAQALGFAVTEEIAEREGRLRVNGFTTYRIPTIRDAPRSIQVKFVEDPYSGGPWGAKGLGEVPLMAGHAAISRAVAHAIGRQVTTYPLSPERVKQALAG